MKQQNQKSGFALQGSLTADNVHYNAISFINLHSLLFYSCIKYPWLGEWFF